MADQVQLRGGTSAESDAFTGANREVTVDTTNRTLRLHDGATAGGDKLLGERQLRFVDDVATLEALAAGVAEQVYLRGKTSSGDGGQGVFLWDASDLSTQVSADSAQWEYIAPTSDATGASGAWVRQTYEVLQADRTVNIPGDYATMQAAVDAQSKWPVANGVKITVNISTGHTPGSGLLVEWGDYSQFVITSDDATVSIDAVFSGVDMTALSDATEGDSRVTNCLIVGLHARMPMLDTLFDMGNAGGSGYVALHGSVAWVRNGAGVQNAGHHGLHSVNSQVEAAGSVWSGATEYGIKCTRASIVSAQDAVANNCNNGVLSSRGSNLHFLGGSATGATGDAARCHRSRLNVDNATLSGAGSDGIFAQLASTVNALNANVSSAGNDGVVATLGSTVNADGVNADGCGRYGLSARSGSTINGNSATITNCTNVGANAFDNSRIALTLGDATGSNGGGANNQIQVQNGSIISAHNATGNLSITANSVTANGIIFQ